MQTFYFIVFCGLVLYGAHEMSYGARRIRTSPLFKSRAVEVTAEILDYRRESHVRPITRHYPNVRFFLGEDKFFGESHVPTYLPFRAGKRVKIKFLPEDPEGAEIKSFSRYISPFVRLAWGTTILLFTAFHARLGSFSINGGGAAPLSAAIFLVPFIIAVTAFFLFRKKR